MAATVNVKLEKTFFAKSHTVGTTVFRIDMPCVLLAYIPDKVRCVTMIPYYNQVNVCGHFTIGKNLNSVFP